MRKIDATHVATVFVIGLATVIALETFAANETTASTNRFRVTVTEVFGSGDSVVKQIRIDAKAGSLGKITSDKNGGGALSASAGSVANQPDQGVITVAVFADHVEWKAGNVNVLKFLVSMRGGGSKALMSDTGPMVAGKQLSDLIAIPLKSGDYEYDSAIPMLRFKDTTFSLTVAVPASQR